MCCPSGLYVSALTLGSLLLRWLSVVTLKVLRGLNRNLWKGSRRMPSVSTTRVNLQEEQHTRHSCGYGKKPQRGHT